MTTSTRDIPNATSAAQPLDGLSFIETQFPVSKLSLESYRERKSPSQTLTGVGKWWGRKPLVLCRATILGLLLPATDNPQKDREIFLRLMIMDDEGMLRRMTSIPQKVLYSRLPPNDRSKYFSLDSTEAKATFKKGTKRDTKKALQERVFLSMTYDERLNYCDRIESISGPSPESWKAINAHLGTTAKSIVELVKELGSRQFGHIPRVGDSFCGGGSIPFEAARIGCEAYGSDLNPVAAMLTWAAINIVGGGPTVTNDVHEVQQAVYDTVNNQIIEWKIDHREPDPETGRQWRADAYLYCAEATCPECGWRIPLSPSWVIAEKTNVVAQLLPDTARKRFDFEIVENVTNQEFKTASTFGTVKDSELVCPNCENRTPIKVLRGDGRGTFGESKSLIRGWENDDVVPREGDILGERLYCIRWVDSWTEWAENLSGEIVEKTITVRHYLAPTPSDLMREKEVHALLMERFVEWQKNGYIPSKTIEPGAETSRLARERGWTYWHHLFTPRQLLVHGLLASEGSKKGNISIAARVGIRLGVSYLANWNSRLCSWIPNLARSGGIGASAQTFYNQALNTFFNFAIRPIQMLKESFSGQLPAFQIQGGSEIKPADARQIVQECDLWVTDPPYADAVNYHELGNFFLAWLSGTESILGPEWYIDAKSALAVSGNEGDFLDSMIACYSRLAKHMPDNGSQVVMFTHQDAGVWAQLALILWAAGLRVTAAWCVATETNSAVKDGNYVQGTVLLVLRKQKITETAFLDEVYQEVEVEVHRQLDLMKDLDDAKDPNFGDTDYQLAAYAAALRVLTSKQIEEIDVAYELSRTRIKGEKSPVEETIEKAVQIACDHLVPVGLETHLWKSLTSLERLYVKGLELESHGEHRSGVYQELARGFGVDEYKNLLSSTKANETRLRTATEFGRKDMGDTGFGGTLLRHLLFATHKTVESEGITDGITWLKTEIPDYASNRQRVIELLEYLATFRTNASMIHWHEDADAAALLAGALRNRADNV